MSFIVLIALNFEYFNRQWSSIAYQTFDIVSLIIEKMSNQKQTTECPIYNAHFRANYLKPCQLGQFAFNMLLWDIFRTKRIPHFHFLAVFSKHIKSKISCRSVYFVIIVCRTICYLYNKSAS